MRKIQSNMNIMNRGDKRTLMLTTVVCLLPIILSIAMYDKLPAQVPIHFNARWEADGYMPKLQAVIGLPVFMVILNFITQFMIYNDPKKANASKVIKSISIWLIPVISVILLPSTIFIGLGYEVPLKVIIPVGIGVLIIAIGNYLPKCRQNYTIGIKLPWTLSDEDNWNKTHHMAGYLWIIGGMIMVVYGCFNINLIPIVIAFLVMTIVPCIYSYVLYRKVKK